MDRFQPVTTVRADGGVAGAHLEGDAVPGEIRLQLGIVRVGIVGRADGRPEGPRGLAKLVPIILARDGEHLLRLLELVREIPNVLVDLVVVDDVAVHLRQCGVPVGNAPQRDHKLEQIGVRLLPEGFLRFPEQVVQQRPDRVRDGVGIEIVVQGVVADARLEPDLQVVRLTARLREHGPHLRTEVPLHLQDQAAHLPVSIVRAPPQQLIDVRIHARGRLTGPDRTKDHHAGIETTLRNRQPRRRGRAAGRTEEMRFAQDQ